MKIQSLEEGKYYHIYNRGINGENLFRETENYSHFLRLYEKYIEPVADTFAWCLLKNHFHLLIRVKKQNEIILDKLEYTTTEKPKQLNISRQFSHLFNSYSQSINKRYNRTGGLFHSPFKRIHIANSVYFRQLIFYIHNNPVHHGFSEKLQDYSWSSYGSIISVKPTRLKRKEVLGYFENVENFVDYHNQQHDLVSMEGLLID